MNTTPEDMDQLAICECNGASDGNVAIGVQTAGTLYRPGDGKNHPTCEGMELIDSPHKVEAIGNHPRKWRQPMRGGVSRCIEDIARADRLLSSAGEGAHLAEMAEDAGISQDHFLGVFKKQLILTPREYGRTSRKRHLQTGLVNAGSNKEAVLAAGKGGRARADADDTAFGGRSAPNRRDGKGETIFYATAATSLGEILVAMTRHGLCMVEFLDSREVETVLRARFAFAPLHPAGRDRAIWIREVVFCIDPPADGAQKSARHSGGIPLDIHGTAFQKKVWQALLNIPPGETRSYGDLARELGCPQSARAIGAACAANPVSVVVPCHRVVGAKGDLTGYRWGMARKRELLQRETFGHGGNRS